MVGTGKFFRVLWCKFLVIWFAGIIALSSKTTGKCSHLVQFVYCHYVIKYFMRDMMNYHCLKVFRSRVKRIGKHSPEFSMF